MVNQDAGSPVDIFGGEARCVRLRSLSSLVEISIDEEFAKNRGRQAESVEVSGDNLPPVLET